MGSTPKMKKNRKHHSVINLKPLPPVGVFKFQDGSGGWGLLQFAKDIRVAVSFLWMCKPSLFQLPLGFRVFDLNPTALGSYRCLVWTQELLTLLFRVGLGGNLERSDGVPSHDFMYVGVHSQIFVSRMVPPSDRMEGAHLSGPGLAVPGNCVFQPSLPCSGLVPCLACSD